MTSIYLIGSLRNEKIPDIANELEGLTGYNVFDDWFSPGPEADDYWRKWAKDRSMDYEEALRSYAATHVYEFDKFHLDRCDVGVLAMPAGKSAHLELGYLIGKGKPGFILFDGEPERWDVMVQFATGIAFSMEQLVDQLNSL